MDAVTYPATNAAVFLRRETVTLRLPHDHQPLAEKWGVVRTPCLVLVDGEGVAHHRTTGFLGPEALMAAVTLGLAKVRLDTGALESAIALLDRLLREYPSTDAAAEALYVRGRSRFRLRSDPALLKETYEQLRARFPESEWARRAFKYRLL